MTIKQEILILIFTISLNSMAIAISFLIHNLFWEIYNLFAFSLTFYGLYRRVFTLQKTK